MELGRLKTGLLSLAVSVSIVTGTPVADGPARASALPQILQFTGGLTADAGWSEERAFEVMPGTAQLEIEVACETGAGALVDFGVRGPAGIRGWSLARDARVQIGPTSASAGYLPGPIEPGPWHIMVGPPPGADGRAIPYHITVRLSNQLDAPRPILGTTAGWFAGDLHVHSGHSDGYHPDNRGRQRPVTVQDLTSRAESAHLDFLAVTDHNTASHWVDVDRTQAAFPDLLLLHGREITTARGHFNAIGERRFTDFRLGPRRPMAQLLADVARDGAFVSINHAWLTSDEWCGGCGWIDRDAGTMSHVAGIEIVNGSTPDDEAGPKGPALRIAGPIGPALRNAGPIGPALRNAGPIGPALRNAGPSGPARQNEERSPGWEFWAARLNRGERLVAVSGSDVHDPIDGRASIGRPSTVVWASALSEDALVAGLMSGRVFVRAEADPHAFLDLSADVGTTTRFMGQTMTPGRIALKAKISGAAGRQLTWIRRGVAVGSTDLRRDQESVALEIDGASGDWFSAIVNRGGRPSLYSNAIYVR